MLKITKHWLKNQIDIPYSQTEVSILLQQDFFPIWNINTMQFRKNKQTNKSNSKAFSRYRQSDSKISMEKKRN